MISNGRSLLCVFGLILIASVSVNFSVNAQIPAEILENADIPKIPGVTAPAEGEREIVKTHVPPSYVKGWIAVAANEIFTFNASNYPERREENKKLFSEVGGKSFFRGIESSFIKIIKEKDQNVKGYIVSPILLLDPQKESSIVYWEASFDYVMEYTSKSGTSYQFLNITVEIKDESDEYDPKLEINRWRSEIDPSPVFCACNLDGTPKKGETLGDKIKRQLDIKDEPATEEPETQDPMAPYQEYINQKRNPTSGPEE